MKTALRHPAGLELQDVAPSDPWETIRRGRRLISRKVGLIRQIAENPYQSSDPAIFAAGAVLADLSRCVPGGQALTAAGAGESAMMAVVSAIGEAVERHCACVSDRDGMLLGTFRELRDDAVPPDRLRLFSREQVERFGPRGPVYFDESSPVRWVWAYSLTDRRSRLVPASLVFLNHRPDADEAHIGLSASTGLAAGATREEAILSGLLETVERDAFTLSWMHRRAGRLIEIDDEAGQAIVRERLWTDRPSVDVRVFDLTTDIAIPVVFLIMRRRIDFGPLVCLGAASKLSPPHAIRKAILEGGQNFPLVRNLLAIDRTWEPAEDFSNLLTFDHNFLTYVKRPDFVAPAFRFFDDCADRVALSRMPDRSTGRVRSDIDYAVAALRAAGHEVLVVDITTPEIADIGFSVVRVIVPGLVPLHGTHQRPYLGVRRLFDAPARLGWDRRGCSPDTGLNPYPHPFP